MTEKRKPGRPSTATHPTMVAEHIDSGRTVAWSDGVFAGDPGLVTAARTAADLAMRVSLYPAGPVVTTSADNPDGAAAAMLSIYPGRMLLLTVPPILEGVTPDPHRIY